jgi:acyl carrier protein
MREWIAAAALAAGVVTAPEALAATPIPMVEILDRVRAEAASQLGRKKSDIEITRPLFEQGLDELDLVELVMALEEKFEVELPDAELAPLGKESMDKLTVQRLAEVVDAQLKKKR